MIDPDTITQPLAALVHERDLLNSQLQELQNSLGTMPDDLRLARQQAYELTQQNANLTQDVANGVVALNAKQAELDGSQATVVAQVNEISGLTASLVAATSDGTLTAQLNAAQSALAAVTAERDAALERLRLIDEIA